MTAQNLTPHSLLAAIRAGTLSATLDPCESVPPLADDADQYPRAEILLQIDGETIREITVWKYVYRCTGNDPLHGEQILPQGSWQTRTAASDGATRGTPRLDITAGADENNDEIPQVLTITTGEGCGPVEPLDLYGLTMEEAEEVADEVGEVVSTAYRKWSPEMPEDSDLWQALTDDGPWVRSVAVSVDIGEANDAVSLTVYGGKHCGQPVFAIQGDEEEEVYDDAQKALQAAGGMLHHALEMAAESLQKQDFADLAQELRVELE